MRLALALALIAAPAFAEDDDHLSERDGLRLVHGWTTATDGGEVHVYFEIENERDAAVTLTGAEAEIAAETALMGVPLTAGGDPLPLDDLVVDGGGAFELGPESVYLRLTGVDGALAEGDSFDVEILFGEEELDLHVEVEAANATQHSHAGHAH